MVQAKNWQFWLLRVVLLLWGFQGLWLIWHFREEAQDLAWRLVHGQVGQAIRREDPFWQWLASLEALMPPGSTYVFLDNYEAGKEIEARYRLTPRRHLLLPPDVPPSFLFYHLRQGQASFLMVRDKTQPQGPGLLAAGASPAFQPMDLPGPGLVFRVDPARLGGEFYD